MKKNSNYYGSDLNRFIDEKCKRNITVNNIDLIIWDFIKRRLRIIESKHLSENWKSSQHKLLNFLADVFRLLNKITRQGYKFEIFIVKGDYPFDGIEIHDMINPNIHILKGQERIRDWLQFDYELEDNYN